MKKIKQLLANKLAKVKDNKKALATVSTATILVAMIAVYCVTVILYNIFEAKYIFLADFGWQMLGEPLIIGMGAGTLISWIVFLMMDVITEVWGKDKAVKILSFAMVLSIVTSLLGGIIARIPGDGAAIDFIFGFQFRVTIFSAFAFWVGNYVNASIMHIMRARAEDKEKTTHKGLFAFRAVVSTLFGQFIDNALFLVLALGPFAASGFWASPFGYTWPAIASSIVVGLVLEVAIETILVPFVTIPLSHYISKKKAKEESEK